MRLSITKPLVGLTSCSLVLFLVASCGYSDPYSPSGPAATVGQPTATPTQSSFNDGANLPQTTLPDGLKYADIKVGTGTTASSGDHFSVYYTLYLDNGNKVDSNIDPGKSPLQGTLDNSGALIPGFIEGIKGMRVDGRRRIFVPGNTTLGYGATPPSGIPPNADLIFIVQLVSVNGH